MRFGTLFAFGLVANVAIASVCKPRHSSTSGTASVEPVTSTRSATATMTAVEAEITTTSADLSTAITSTVDDETTLQATETATTTDTSMVVEVSTTPKTNSPAESTTTAEVTTPAESTSTAQETTTAYTTTTTADNFEPIPTFNVLSIGSQVDGQKLRGHVTTFYEMGWNLNRQPPIHAYSIDPDTNQVKEVNGNYLCLQYGDNNKPNYANLLKLCDPGTASEESLTTVISTEAGTAVTTSTAIIDVSTSVIRSAAIDSFATGTTAIDVTTSDLPLSTTTETTGIMETGTTADPTAIDSTTYDLPSSMTTETTIPLETTTAAETTSTAEPTTTANPTTSESAPEPYEAFGVLARSGPFNGQYIKGTGNEAEGMGWNLAYTENQLPPFIIEHGTNYAKMRNGLYLCIGYSQSSLPILVMGCSSGRVHDLTVGFLTCEQAADQKFKCSAPASQCVYEPSVVCTPTLRTLDQFYIWTARSDGYWLALGSSNAPSSTYQPVDLGLTLNQSK
ncbi:hypothetical protein IL306_006649 [Fusarium sp. DS 682]|nr:hypothetical protein IL306_006649 [Fusarium sp. DS 682]